MPERTADAVKLALPCCHECVMFSTGDVYDGVRAVDVKHVGNILESTLTVSQIAEDLPLVLAIGE